jgi:hypothetical protein
MASLANVLADPDGFEQTAVQRVLFQRPKEDDYKKAVRQILLTIKAAHGYSNAEIAKALGCSIGTVKNAVKDYPPHCLDAVTLLNIAWIFKEQAIAPVRALYLCNPADAPTIADDFDDLRARLNALEKRTTTQGYER